jgi:hypothetical protein
MTDVHPERDVRLLSIAPEGALANEDADEQPAVELAEWYLARRVGRHGS